MEIAKIMQRDQGLIGQLQKVWRASVEETHLFLSKEEVDAIEKFIPQALAEIPHLVVAQNDNGTSIGFMGIEEQKLEMLFIAPQERGHGVGKALLEYGMREYGVNSLGVNEQNPQAKGFYEHMGFCVYKRTETDEQGMPYPILYMKLQEK